MGLLNFLKIIFVAFLLMNIAGCKSSDDDAPAPEPSAEAEAVSALFADYVPLDADHPCTGTYKYIYGGSAGVITGITADTEEQVFYLSGVRYGIRTTYSFPDGTTRSVLFSNTGTVVYYLGYDSIYFSSDMYFFELPSILAYRELVDGKMVYQSSLIYLINQGAATAGRNDNRFVRIQDVRIGSITYPDAVVMYILDSSTPFATLDFHGVNTALGLSLPVKSNTIDTAVKGFEIYGAGKGLIAAGEVTASTGSLTSAYVLDSIICR